MSESEVIEETFEQNFFIFSCERCEQENMNKILSRKSTIMTGAETSTFIFRDRVLLVSLISIKPF